MRGCEEWQELASARLDGEVAPPEKDELSEHLGECPSCAGADRELRVARSAVGRLRAREPVPAALAARIKTSALRASPSGLSAAVPRLARPALVLACLAGLYVVAWEGMGRHERRLPDLCTTLVEDHLRYMGASDPGDVPFNDPEEVRSWLEARLPFRVSIPVLPGSRLIGGRVCFVHGHRVALLFYEIAVEGGSERISLFELPPGVALGGLSPGPSGSWQGGMHGYRLRARKSRDVTYALVSGLPGAAQDRMWAHLENQLGWASGDRTRGVGS